MYVTVEVIFLFIEFLYYDYGLYEIYFDMFDSILCFGVSVLALTLIRIIVAVVFHGSITVLCIEAFYAILVIVYGWVGNRRL